MQKSKPNYLLFLLLFILPIVSIIVSFYPLFVNGPRAVFYNFEPSVAYVANAFRYIYTHKILYSGHPGTPSMVLLANLFVPLRIYVKLFEHTPFLLWVIKNIFTFFYYARLVQGFIFMAATSIFLLAVFNLTKKFLAILIAWFGLWTYSYTPYLATVIQSEPTSFLILSIWFLVFSGFLKKKSCFLFYLLCILSGLSIANKFPNTFFALASIPLAFTFTNLKIKSRTLMAIKGSMLAFVAFIIGTWPIRERYSDLLNLVFKYATHSGVHGSGKSTIFNLADYLLSINILIVNEKLPAILILVTIFLFAIFYKRLGKTLRGAMLIFLSSMVFATVIFAKYPLVHYVIFLYFGVLFTFCYLIAKIGKPIQILIIGLLAIYAFGSLTNYWKLSFNALRQTLVLENFVEKKPPRIASVWEFGFTSDYALIHIRDWSRYPFSELLKQERPNLYSLSTDLSKVVTEQGKTENLFDVCWDQLYIQKVALNKFIEKYADQKFKIFPIRDSIRTMYIVTSDHCKKGF